MRFYRKIISDEGEIKRRVADRIALTDGRRISIWRRLRVDLASRLAERRAGQVLRPILEDRFPVGMRAFRSMDRQLALAHFRHRRFHDCEPS